MTEPVFQTFDFNIPSIQDSIDLEGRLHVPTKIFQNETNFRSWCPKGAIIAHPYALMGGCQDDPIVLCMVESLVSQNFVVGTFNFRGAGNSKGRTSWTAKAESQDYISVAGLLVYFLKNLQPPRDGLDSTAPIPPIKLLLSGYSYGALVTRLLPEVVAFQSLFVNTRTGSAAVEIRLRARHLALSILKLLPSFRDENGTSLETHQAPEEAHEAIGLPEIAASYLLISPILGSVAGLATMFSSSSTDDERKLTTHPSLVVYGDSDVFTSRRKLRQWCERLQAQAMGLNAKGFSFCEVEGAGHFWREAGSLGCLKKTVREWVEDQVIGR